MGRLRVPILALLLAPIAYCFEQPPGDSYPRELWRRATAAPLESLPLVVDFDTDGSQEVLIASRYDGTVWVLSAEGALRHRYTGPRWLAGSVAAAPDAGVFAYEESAGSLILTRFSREMHLGVALGGETVPGGGTSFADLNADGTSELVCARRNGIVTAFDLKGKPIWQFAVGSPIVAPPAIAPVFDGRAGVYVRAGDGAMYAFAGDGEPLWRRQLTRGASPEPCVAVQFGFGHPVILCGGADGRLHAIDAVDGTERWRTELAKSGVGVPAVANVLPNSGREIVVVSEDGDIAVLDADGSVIQRASLPEGRYLPRPLVADVDGDARAEVLVPCHGTGIVVAGLDGEVKTTLALQGDIREGIVLADLTGDGFLELIAATDRAQVHCFATRAETGWTHPRARVSLDGCVEPFANTHGPPSSRRTFARAAIKAITTTGFTKKPSLTVAHVRVKERARARYVSAAIRQDDGVVGAAYERFDPNGLTIPFLQSGVAPLKLDLVLRNAEGRPIASSKDVAVRPSSVELIELASPDGLLDALAYRASCLVTPKAWRLPDVSGRTSWYVLPRGPEGMEEYGLERESFIADALREPKPGQPLRVVGGDEGCTPLQLAVSRGAARRQAASSWGVSISNRFAGTIADTRYRGDAPAIDWSAEGVASGPRCGHSPSLEFRLGMSAHLSGATFVSHEFDPERAPILVTETSPGKYALSPFGMAAKRCYEYACQYPRRGVPYTPIALLRGAGDDASTEAFLDHVYAREPLDFERGYLTNGPYGDVFDVLGSTAKGPIPPGYGVVWPLGSLPPDTRALEDYVEHGGVLVLDGRSASSFPAGFLGVRFSKKAGAASEIQTALGNLSAVRAPYRFRRMRGGPETETLAWTDTGEPLLTWRAAGQGIVIVCATECWNDEGGHLLPIAPALLRVLADAFLPVHPPSDVEMFLSRTEDGWMIGLINNNGIKKIPTARATADEDAARDCVVGFKDRAPLRFLPRMGSFRWDNLANGLHTRLGPGHVAVVEVVLPHGEGG